MAYDLTRCPQTEEEFQEYFYTLIGRAYGDVADGWEATMTQSYPWQGHMLNIPPGVGPGHHAAAGCAVLRAHAAIQRRAEGPDLPAVRHRRRQRLFHALYSVSRRRGGHLQQIEKASHGEQQRARLVVVLGGGPRIQPVTVTDSTAPPDSSLDARVTALEAEMVAVKEVSMAMGEEHDDLAQRVAVIENMLTQGLHAHGPINLPIVLESGPSLRCKGDIDVQVKPGQANPPDMTADPIDPRSSRWFCADYSAMCRGCHDRLTRSR